MLFDNHRDASMRLVDTIVFYQGRAMMVNDISPRALKLRGRIILTGEEVSVHQTDDDLQMHCPPVGYVNVEGDSLYFMRQPMRRWKQGIDMRALICPTAGMRARGMINERLLAKCLENDYPNLEQAMGMFVSRNPFKDVDKKGVAFSKHFSVRKGADGPLLHYKGREVGVVENATPILSTDFQWLQEHLEESL